MAGERHFACEDPLLRAWYQFDYDMNTRVFGELLTNGAKRESEEIVRQKDEIVRRYLLARQEMYKIVEATNNEMFF